MRWWCRQELGKTQVPAGARFREQRPKTHEPDYDTQSLGIRNQDQEARAGLGLDRREAHLSGNPESTARAAA